MTEQTRATRTPAVVWWAVIGAVFLAIEVFVMVKWVSGPYFTRVHTGADDPPGWMKTELIISQAGSVLLFLVLAFWFVFRPWRRERRLTTDGALLIASALVVWQDPLCSYFSNWFTYNSYMVNVGSWAADVPGWVSPQRPGAMIAEPILLSPTTYGWLWLGLTLIGCAVMRRARARWPGMSDLRLVALVVAFMFFMDLLVEGLLILPAGWFEYPGGHFSLWPSTYHKWPLHEGLFAGSWFAALTCVRFFTNDKGQPVVERGVDTLRAGEGRRSGLRLLAWIGITNVIALAAYNVPTAVITGRSSPWPQDLQKRSYLTDGICGPGTTFACPGPGVPLPRTAESAHLDPNGHLIVPPGVRLPFVPPARP